LACSRTYKWVKSGYVNKTTEGFLFAAQEQALATKMCENVNAYCRKCGKHVETIAHLASGCRELAQLEYKKMHDRMGLRVYWELCKKYGVKVRK